MAEGPEVPEEEWIALQDKAFADAADRSFAALMRLQLRMLLRERRQRRAFERQLYASHRLALDNFEHFLTACYEIGVHVHSTEAPIRESLDDSLYGAIARIHARACLIASEIRALMFAGHASGALARWRTLHELAVICLFLSQHGSEAAERYMWSEVVKTAREARKYNVHSERLGMDPLEPDDLAVLESEAAQLVSRYGKVIKGDWGWASFFLPNKPDQPNFTDVEKAVSLDHWQPQVGMAHHAVHGGFKGAIADIGTGPFRYAPIMLSGPSMRGLIVPADATLLDLYRCTMTFLFLTEGLESRVQGAALTLLLRRTREAFAEVERRLSAKDDETGPGFP